MSAPNAAPNPELSALATAAANSGPDGAALSRFVERFYARVPQEDLALRPAEAWLAVARDMLAFAAGRAAGAPKLRLVNPETAPQGFGSSPTVLQIANDDMPFLVDSVSMALAERSIGIHLLVHPVIDGESLMHIEIDRQATEDFAGIQQAIEAALGDVRAAVAPLLESITQLTAQIRAYDRQIQHQLLPQYPIAQRLASALAGVGPLTALAVVLLIDDPARFRHSRDVGAYFGLVPKLDESGDATPQLRITKAGDPLGRRLLVSAAHYILHRGPDSALRRHGAALMQRGGPNARKRAVIAVARKLVVLLHRLWVTGAAYDPTRGLAPAA